VPRKTGGITMTSHFYFAYGSNMDPDQMSRRCPKAEPIGAALLEDWRVAINARGVATIVPEEGSLLEGVLWSVSETCLESLDGYEGVANGVYFKETLRVRESGRVVEAVVYVASSSDFGEPRRGYLEGILRGAAHFGLSETYRRRLAALASPKASFPPAQPELATLAARIRAGRIGRAKPWGGADVAIVSEAPAVEGDGFYPPHRFVVTPWAPQLSWVFEEITSVLLTKFFYTFETKFGIFARLADAANTAGTHNAPLTVVLNEVVQEAILVCAHFEELWMAPSI
jgi:cation transport regulator ChaC